MNKKLWIVVILVSLISSTVLFLKTTESFTPKEVYRVYLSGKTIGYVNSKADLEKYIDKKETDIKEKYAVSKVYAPRNLDVVKETTYNKDVSSIEEIYNKIKSISPFTVQGYTVTIKGISESKEEGTYVTEDIKINVLNKKVFTDALKKTTFVFVKESDYNKYINKTQEEVVDTGSIIENIYIENDIYIRENKLSVNDKIFSDVEELSKYLLFGTLTSQKQYTVKKGDTIEQVSFDNKLSVEEFLIANTNFTSVNNLLYPGETVVLGIIKPAFKIIEEDHIVELEQSKYKTEIVYDNSIMLGTEKVKQNGVNGTNKVTKKVQKANGEVVSAVVVKSETIKPAINKIIVRGKGNISVGSLGSWAWPTKIPYIITSNYAWRWGTFHEGLDISGTGHGSPIYAANDGVVEVASYTKINGNYIIINHNNGYYTYYGHLSSFTTSKGKIVTIGEQIGRMGTTGYSTGTHLHFGVYKGYPWRGGYSINPFSLYR